MPRKPGTAGTQNKAMQAKIAAKFGASSSRTGGRGSVRRKFKAPPKSSMQDDKRLQLQLKKLSVNPIPAIEEVNLFKDDNTVVHFTKPKVQAEISSNTYVISGQCETKKLEELIPQILPQLGREHIDSLKDFANTFNQLGAADEDDDEVPVLVDDNFEAVASSDVKNESEKPDDAPNDATATETQDNAETAADAADAADATDAANKDDNANDATDAAAADATDAKAVDATEATEAEEVDAAPDAAANDATATEAKPEEATEAAAAEPEADKGAAVDV